MACTTCASECLCAVVSGDSIISVTGVGSGTVPYTVTANICNGLSTITDGARDVLNTDKAVVINGSGECELVTVPTDCIPYGGTTNQVLMKDSAADCDLAWKTPPYCMVTKDVYTTPVVLTNAVPAFIDWDATTVDAYGMFDPLSPTVLTVPWDGWWSFGFSSGVTSWTDDASINKGQVIYQILAGAVPVNQFYNSALLPGLSDSENLYTFTSGANYLTAGSTITLIATYQAFGVPTGTVQIDDMLKMWAHWVAA